MTIFPAQRSIQFHGYIEGEIDFFVKVNKPTIPLF